MLYVPSSDVSNITLLHIVFCVNAKACQNYLDNRSNNIYGYNLDGKNTFLFRYIDKKGISTYNLVGADKSNPNTRDTLLNGAGYGGYGCSKSFKAYCSALIESDGWQISDDYPIKF